MDMTLEPDRKIRRLTTVAHDQSWLLTGVGLNIPCPSYRKTSRNHDTTPVSKVYGATMEPIWGRQDPGGHHVSPINVAIWDNIERLNDAETERCHSASLVVNAGTGACRCDNPRCHQRRQNCYHGNSQLSMNRIVLKFGRTRTNFQNNRIIVYSYLTASKHRERLWYLIGFWSHNQGSWNLFDRSPTWILHCVHYILWTRNFVSNVRTLRR